MLKKMISTLVTLLGIVAASLLVVSPIAWAIFTSPNLGEKQRLVFWVAGAIIGLLVLSKLWGIVFGAVSMPKFGKRSIASEVN